MPGETAMDRFSEELHGGMVTATATGATTPVQACRWTPWGLTLGSFAAT
jgi:hypothetical protein